MMENRIEWTADRLREMSKEERRKMQNRKSYQESKRETVRRLLSME